MSDLEFPFNETNTAHVGVMDGMVRRAVSYGLNEPWIVAPVEELIQHCNVHGDDSHYKLSLMALRDQGIKFLLLPPTDTLLDNGLGDTTVIAERVEPNHHEIL